MKHLILFGLLISASQIFAQEVLSSGGDHFTTTDYAVSFTLGELAIETVSSTDRILTQGFHQTNLTITSVSEVTSAEVLVYPNPASNVINITGLEQFNVLRYRLVDVTGRTVLDYQGSMLSTLDVSPFPVGFYVLSVTSPHDLNLNYSATIQKL